MPVPVQSVTPLPILLPHPMVGAAVVQRRALNDVLLVGPGVVRVQLDSEGVPVAYHVVTPVADLPNRLVGAVLRDDGLFITVYGGSPDGRTATDRIFSVEIGTGEVTLVGTLPRPMRALAARKAPRGTLLLAGIDAEGYQRSDIAFVDNGTEIDQVDLHEGMGVPTAPGAGLPQIVVVNQGFPPVRRIFVLGTGYQPLTEIIPRRGEPRSRIAPDVQMPYPTRSGGACSILGGRGFCYVGGSSVGAMETGAIITWDGTGNPSLAGSALPHGLVAPAVFASGDSVYVISGQSGIGQWDGGTAHVDGHRVRLAIP